MKNKKADKKLTKDQAEKKILSLKKDLFNIRFKKINGQVTNPAQFNLIRKNIARLYSNLKGIEAGIPTLKSFECHMDDLKHLENGRPIKCPITINLSEGEEIVAKHEGRVAGILFKDGFFLKVRRKLNT